eukprot:Amastigsp_a348753_5.p3 type:complete len:152 gc:universal Amastigsp_a348753_5:379-834(+)
MAKATLSSTSSCRAHAKCASGSRGASGAHDAASRARARGRGQTRSKTRRERPRRLTGSRLHSPSRTPCSRSQLRTRASRAFACAWTKKIGSATPRCSLHSRTLKRSWREHVRWSILRAASERSASGSGATGCQTTTTAAPPMPMRKILAST